MVENYICEGCTHALVCKKREILDKFSDEAKKPLNIIITMNSCSDYEEVS